MIRIWQEVRDKKRAEVKRLWRIFATEAIIKQELYEQLGYTRARFQKPLWLAE